MTDSKLAIEQGLSLFLDLIESDEALAAELDSSRSVFFGPGERRPESDEERLLSDRRHLEWFLHERYSEAVEGVPVEALMDRWLEQAAAPEIDFAEAFLGSRAGLYEVTGVTPGQGVWLHDLLAAGQYPLEEPEAALGLSAGDLVVGRIFPVGDSLYRASPAAACFRSADLLEALRADMERLRETRRGTPHVPQSELERMFFTPAAPAAGDVVGEVDELLERAGLDEAERRVALEALAHDAAATDPVAGLLEHLAMESSIDLEPARRVLIAARAVLLTRGRTPLERDPLEPRRVAPARTGASPARVAGEPAGAETPAERELAEPRTAPSRGDARAALQEFDRGRAEGRDLDLLFRELERRLGLESDADEDLLGAEDELAPLWADEAPDATGHAAVPEFPDVVAAVVEEFLWDVEREAGPEARRDVEAVRWLGRYARGVDSLGVFENLGARDVALFLSCWVLEQGELDSGAAARALVEATNAFARWVEEQHEFPLATRLTEEAPELGENLVRAVEANRELASWAAGRPARTSETRLGSLRLEDDRTLVELGPGRSAELALPPACRRWLRDGDLVAAVEEEDGALSARRVYPPEAGAFLRRGA